MGDYSLSRAVSFSIPPKDQRQSFSRTPNHAACFPFICASFHRLLSPGLRSLPSGLYHLLSSNLSSLSLIRSLQSLISLNLLLSRSSAFASDCGCLSLLTCGLLLWVNLHNPVVLAVLVGALVPPLWLPLAGRVVVLHLLTDVGGLGLDALFAGELLPGGLGLWWWKWLRVVSNSRVY